VLWRFFANGQRVRQLKVLDTWKTKDFPREAGSHPASIAWRTLASIVLTENLSRCESWSNPTQVTFLRKRVFQNKFPMAGILCLH
jgi:hypothetical protein